ncbi:MULTISPECIES: hypothetical protein [Hyphobacterium]|uniref:Disulfide bond formation protein B n=1 Tax=Hyphobacterium vulgare TaxID=1736751 RepID=A0ABV6ZW18_9PROT
MMLVLFILMSGAGIAAAWWLRERIRSWRWNVFAALLMMGLLAPMFAGQLIALMVSGGVEASINDCRAAGGGVDCNTPTQWLILPLIAGIAAGAGWFCGALGFKFTGSEG